MMLKSTKQFIDFFCNIYWDYTGAENAQAALQAWYLALAD